MIEFVIGEEIVWGEPTDGAHEAPVGHAHLPLPRDCGATSIHAPGCARARRLGETFILGRRQ